MAFSWAGFRKRKLVQWALGYLAGAWLAYEVLSQVGENFAWPAVVLRVVTVLLVAGLPMVLVMAWYHGERGQQKVGVVELGLLVLLAGMGAIGVRLVMAGAGEGMGRSAMRGDEGILLNSIAVLPLANRSGDPSQEYFSDGITEELMGALARVPGLRLAARTSSFAFKGREVAVDSISRALRVRHLLDGSVRRQGDSLLVAVALVDARNKSELWSGTFRRAAVDVFAIQREIARAVVDALPLEPVLLEADWELPEYSTSQKAYDYYLLGKQSWNRRTGPELLRAIEFFERAIALDSTYAPAWAALAQTYVLLPGYTAFSSQASNVRLRETAARALELDSLLVEAHTALGYGMWFERDFAMGIRLLDRALEIDPDYATALHWQGEMLAHAGRFEESLANFALALEVDPLSRVIQADYGQALQLGGRLEEAVEQLERLLAEDPGYLIGEYWLFYPALLTGRYERAEELIRNIAQGVGLDPDGMALAVRAVAGDVPRDAGLAALDAQPRSVSGVGLTALTALYAQLGAVDRAYAVLQSRHFQGAVYLVTHPVLEPLRDDRRYDAFEEALRLP